MTCDTLKCGGWDKSPKGFLDEPIRELVTDINKAYDMVTTSSCSGRVSLFQEKQICQSFNSLEANSESKVSPPKEPLT